MHINFDYLLNRMRTPLEPCLRKRNDAVENVIGDTKSSTFLSCAIVKSCAAS